MTDSTPRIAKPIVGHDQSNGIDVSILKKDTILKVRTKKSKYTIHLLGDNRVLVCGGKFFEQPTRAIFYGSTWGGSMIKSNWIGENMHMEFGCQLENGLDTILTSGVQAVTVISPDGIISLTEWVPLACNA